MREIKLTTSPDFIQADTFPALAALVNHQIMRWPEHERFLHKSFTGRTEEVMATSELVARQVLKLARQEPGGLTKICDDYRFMCTQILLPEEEFFRRHDAYRLTKFEDALREVYQNEAIMGPYVNGLLLSQIFWSNHASSFDSFLSAFLPRIPRGGQYLEIGPGHGVFLYLAATARPDLAKIAAWDVSPTSIAKTAACLKTMGLSHPVDLRLQDVFDIDEGIGQAFDGVVISEVLEHLEKPTEALRGLMTIMKPGAVIWVNVPINCPAPDHLYLMRSLQDAVDMVEASGLQVIDSQAYPMTGTTLERCAKLQLTVTCVITGRKKAV
jgi:2-polyprenyl-3-methyl-5-hydroxy-6-metoxy-1,4-benzoquinol methylase